MALLEHFTLAGETLDVCDATARASIPTKTSELTNDSGFITSANIPTKTSDLTNDSGFITATYNSNTKTIALG